MPVTGYAHEQAIGNTIPHIKANAWISYQKYLRVAIIVDLTLILSVLNDKVGLILPSLIIMGGGMVLKVGRGQIVRAERAEIF